MQFEGRRGVHTWSRDRGGRYPIDLHPINMVGISTHLEFGILGMVILLGVIGDEVQRRLWLKNNWPHARKFHFTLEDSIP